MAADQQGRRDPKGTRGYRNKNPGNLDFVPANKWQGQVGLGDAWLPPEQRRFAAFESHEYGIRALAMLLATYQDRHGLRTVDGIIRRWAPPSENDTAAYVAAVSRAVGVAPNEPIDVHRFEHLRPLVVAIISHELGGNPYDAGTIDRGLALAGVTRRVEGVADAAQTERGRGALQGASATGAAAVSTIVVPALGGLQGLDWRLSVVIVLLAAMAAVAWVLSRRAKARAPVA